MKVDCSLAGSPEKRMESFRTGCCSPKSVQTNTSEDDNEEMSRQAVVSDQLTQQLIVGSQAEQANLQRKPTKDRHSLNKEKSELCKTFMEMGYCPYNQKCKFAHGSHELRQNQQFNSRYKTKVCGSFVKKGFCSYGLRCNFVHGRIDEPQQLQKERTIKTWQLILQLNRDIIYESRTESRLLRLLQLPNQQ